jgi:hypothetical protein
MELTDDDGWECLRTRPGMQIAVLKNVDSSDSLSLTLPKAIAHALGAADSASSLSGSEMADFEGGQRSESRVSKPDGMGIQQRDTEAAIPLEDDANGDLQWSYPQPLICMDVATPLQALLEGESPSIMQACRLVECILLSMCGADTPPEWFWQLSERSPAEIMEEFPSANGDMDGNDSAEDEGEESGPTPVDLVAAYMIEKNPDGEEIVHELVWPNDTDLDLVQWCVGVEEAMATGAAFHTNATTVGQDVQRLQANGAAMVAIIPYSLRLAAATDRSVCVAAVWDTIQPENFFHAPDTAAVVSAVADMILDAHRDLLWKHTALLALSELASAGLGSKSESWDNSWRSQSQHKIAADPLVILLWTCMSRSLASHTTALPLDTLCATLAGGEERRGEERRVECVADVAELLDAWERTFLSLPSL